MSSSSGRKDMLQLIDEVAGNYSRYEIFSDFIKASALAMSNACTVIQDKVWLDREQEWQAIANKHGDKVMHKFSMMLAILALELEQNMSDVLGQVYMEGEMGSKQTGQFFTPFHISKLVAQIAMKHVERGEKYVINEPSCGGGGMIIATAVALRDAGIDYQMVMDVYAQDLDWKSVYMCYLQLSLLGIRATCMQGDTLSGTVVDKAHRLDTPRKAGVLI